MLIFYIFGFINGLSFIAFIALRYCAKLDHRNKLIWQHMCATQHYAAQLESELSQTRLQLAHARSTKHSVAFFS